MKLSPRARLLLLMSLFALPIVASTVAYRVAAPVATGNYGELLLPPRTLPEAPLARPQGGAFRFTELSGKWVLFMAEAGECPEACLEKLTTLRQVRLAAGRDALRVARVFVADDGRAPAAATLVPFEGTLVALAAPGPGTGGLDRGHIYLADPHGNVMMRWRTPVDRQRMYKDLSRLLKASQIG